MLVPLFRWAPVSKREHQGQRWALGCSSGERHAGQRSFLLCLDRFCTFFSVSFRYFFICRRSSGSKWPRNATLNNKPTCSSKRLIFSTGVSFFLFRSVGRLALAFVVFFDFLRVAIEKNCHITNQEARFRDLPKTNRQLFGAILANLYNVL